MNSVAARHADWLSLVEPDGPFVTLPVLRRVFADGLDRAESATREEMRSLLAATDLTDATEARDWCTWVLEELLQWGPYLRKEDLPSELQLIVAEHGAVLRPEFALTDAEKPDTKWRVLVEQYPYRTPLASRMPGDRWAATPVERMALLCRSTGVPVGLVTDGDRWVLVWAPKDAAVGHATFTASLFSEEPTLLDAFVSLLGAKRFFAVADADTIEAMLAESANAQAEVTDQLGRQVRAAVELLVGAISRANLDRDSELLEGIEPRVVYEASLTVMMRLVFLLSAEERGLLPLDDDTYQRFYAIASMREELQAEADLFGEEPLERRSTAWHRMLAQFRAVYGGISHESLRIPAYGGRLFDPDRFPFLEGRTDDEPWRTVIAHPLAVDDLTVLAVLNALQVLEFRQAGVTEARRLTYRTLDVEQIGHVYEGLLDHSAVAAEGLAVGLVGSQKGLEPEIALADLEAADARGELAEWLGEVSGKTAKQVDALLAKEVTTDDRRLLAAAVDNDAALLDRLEPYVHFLRRDLRGLPMVFPAGALFVTETGSRRDSGTAYTTRELAEEVARYALEPLVYSPGPQDGVDPSEWKLRTSTEILDLKVCDPAVGSGAILVAACRYLGERVAEAWTAENAPESAGDPDDMFLAACRAVADRCLFAVDRDPLAVEMAKLSLWLVTMAKERPFTFLDHAVRCGDSLLGITDLDQLRWFHMDPSRGRQIHISLFDYTALLEPLVQHSRDLRNQLAKITVLTIRDVEEKARLAREADENLKDLCALADILIAEAVSNASRPDRYFDEHLLAMIPRVAAMFEHSRDRVEGRDGLQQLEIEARSRLNGGRPISAPERIPLHWPLAFPEVFLNRNGGGFDAIIGNPPFLHGSSISGVFGSDYRSYLVKYVADGRRGTADLVAYFFCRAAGIGAYLGLLATNTIAQGDTREVALDWLSEQGFTIFRAVPSSRWPGAASLFVAKLWLARSQWSAGKVLDGINVVGITPSLRIAGRATSEVKRLQTNARMAFNGYKFDGLGFVLDEQEAKDVLRADPHNAEVVFPLVNAQDLMSRPSVGSDRWIINFFDWPEAVARRYALPFSIVEERVKPERMLNQRQRRREYWWQYGEVSPGLRAITKTQEVLLLMPRHSKVVLPMLGPSRFVYSDAIVVFSQADLDMFGVLSSAFHWYWAISRASTLGTTIRYTPSDVFETFPRPLPDQGIRRVAEALEAHRSAVMIGENEGPTATYNRVHSPDEIDGAIGTLRDLHVSLDLAVRDAYGWADLQLAHGFHSVRNQGVRFTLSPHVADEILDRLRELNHERYGAEVTSGQHKRGRSTPSSRARRKSHAQASLLEEDSE